jgi:hypothetical protein
MTRFETLWICSAVLALTCACGTHTTASDADTSASADGSGDAQIGDGSGDGASSDSDVGPPSLLTARSLRFDEDLTAAWGSDADDVWVVGKGGRVLHWNGATLSPRDAGTKKDLNGVWGVSRNEAYIVGDGVILRWDGSKWSNETPDGTGILRGVHAPADGSSVLACGDGGVVLRRGGSGKWQAEETNSKINLQAIWAINASKVWAVGEQGRAISLSGGSWSESDMPGAASRTVRAVVGSMDGRMFACGDGGYLAATDETATWQQTLANDGDNPRDLKGLWARDGTEAWAIGSSGALLHFVGKKWQIDSIAGTYMKTASFSAMFGSNDSNGQPFGFAFGIGGAGLMFSAGQPDNSDPNLQDDRWLDFRAETVADLKSIQSGSDGSLITCGTSGVALIANDSQAPFYDLAAPVTGADISDCVLRDGEAWLVGPSGVILHHSGGVWSVDKPANAKTLSGIARLGSDLLVVGDGGLALHKVGDGAWQAEATGVQFKLRSVATAGDVAYAVGELGTVLRRDAAGTWSKETTGNLGQFARVVAWGDGEAAAVTEEGALLVRSAGASGTWKQLSETPGQLLYGIARRTDGLLLAVGYAGTLVSGQPAGPFTNHVKNVPNLLSGVACSANGCVVVGQKGGIFQLAEAIP